MAISVTRRPRRYSTIRRGDVPGQPSSSEFIRAPGVIDPSTGGQVGMAPTPELPAGIPGVGGIAASPTGPAPASQTGGGLSGFGTTPGTYRLSPTDPDAARQMAAHPGMYSITSAAEAAPYLAELVRQGNGDLTTAAGVAARRAAVDPYFAALANAQQQGWTTPKAPVVQAATATGVTEPAPVVK